MWLSVTLQDFSQQFFSPQLTSTECHSFSGEELPHQCLTVKSFNGFRKQRGSGTNCLVLFYRIYQHRISHKFNSFFYFESKHSSHHHLIPDTIGGLGSKKTFDCLWVEYPDFILMLPRPGIFLPDIFWAEIWATVLYDKQIVSLRYQAAGDHCTSTTDISEISG